MKESIVFLDIDYVLNNRNKRGAYIGQIRGVDDDKIELLKQIVEFLDADIVLSSSWREFWKPELLTDGVNNWRGCSPYRYGRYLNIRLGQHGLVITDKTPAFYWWERAKEISEWLKEHPEVKRFIILDDEDFEWEKHGLGRYWVDTFSNDGFGYNGGLTPYHVDYIEKHIHQFTR